MWQPEKGIENAVLEYLAARGAFVWKAGHSALPGRRTMNRYHRRGVPDILGAYRRRPIAVEVKTDSGRLSEAQTDFLREYAAAGALVAVVRSVGDAEDAVRAWDRELGVLPGPDGIVKDGMAMVRDGDYHGAARKFEEARALRGAGG
jgi:hypothetical protein